MAAISRLIELFNWISDTFYKLYRYILDWPWPFYEVSGFFYFLSDYTNRIAWAFYDFSFWLEDIYRRVWNILSWDTIWSYIMNRVPNLLVIRDWFYNWWGQVLTGIEIWWSYTQTTVKVWIDNAISWLQAQVNNLITTVGVLQAAWDNLKAVIPTISEVLWWFTNWWGNILRNLNIWWGERLRDVQSLIDSAFLARDSFWSGWQDWRDKVTEFFTDPEDWLYKAVDRIIERFW